MKVFNYRELVGLRVCVLCLSAEVVGVILSDVVFFLAENGSKYTFFSQDNKVRFFRLLHT